MSDTVKVELAEGLLRLTLNRPDKLNSFNDEMHLALRAGFQRAHDESDVRAVLLTGAGRGFCAGQDLGDRDPRKETAPDLGRTIETFYNPLIRQIRSLLYDQGFTIGGARNKLTGEEARSDVSQSQQIVKQVRLELEDVLKILRR